MRSIIPLGPREVAALACPWCGTAPDRGERGYLVAREGRPLGAIVLAPSDRDRDLCPPGASVIERLWVAPSDVGEHVGTQLVQRACAVLVAERARCLVAYGTRGRPDCGHLPAGFLDAAGFREHVDGVQWRIELRRTLAVPPLVRDAAGAAVRLVRGSGRPLPAGRVRGD